MLYGSSPNCSQDGRSKLSKQQHQWSYKQRELDRAIGPVSEAQLVALVKNGTIGTNTLVSSPTRTKNNWYAAGRIPAIAKIIKPPKAKDFAVVPNRPVTAGEAGANPYSATLIASVAVPPGQTKAAKDIYDQFLPLNSTAVAWLLRATMLVMAIHGFLFWCFYHYGRRGSSSIATAQVGVFILQLVLVIATAIFFLRWKYRAYKNLQVACSTPLKTSAGWAVGVYFIPILNLFRPAMAMHEIQSRSKANIGYSAYGWWFLWILSGILARAAMNGPGSNNKAVFVVSIIAVCFSLIAGFLLLKIIRTVTEKQRRYRLSLRDSSN